MNTFYPRVAERAGFLCEYCRAPERVFNFAFQVEHIYPVHLGGLDVLTNLALSCESCNLYKGGAITGWDALSQQDMPLFHPRQQVWEEHFEWNATAIQLGLSVSRSSGMVSDGDFSVNSVAQNCVYTNSHAL